MPGINLELFLAKEYIRVFKYFSEGKNFVNCFSVLRAELTGQMQVVVGRYSYSTKTLLNTPMTNGR